MHIWIIFLIIKEERRRKIVETTQLSFTCGFSFFFFCDCSRSLERLISWKALRLSVCVISLANLPSSFHPSTSTSSQSYIASLLSIAAFAVELEKKRERKKGRIFSFSGNKNLEFLFEDVRWLEKKYFFFFFFFKKALIFIILLTSTRNSYINIQKTI